MVMPMGIVAEIIHDGQSMASAAELVQKLIERNELDEIQIKKLDQIGDLVGQIDWNSPHYKSKRTPELCLEATRLRPLFYGQIIAAGVKSRTYLDRLYQTLKSGGRNNRLNDEELHQTYQAFNAISEKMLRSLQPQPSH